MIEQQTATGEEAPAQETATLPMSILGGQQVSEGDTVRLKVLSVDAESGSLTVAYAHPPKTGGINKMAAQFSSPVEKE